MAFLDLSPSDRSKFPFIAYIETTFPERKVSGTGALIGPRLVLTAGHVVFDPPTPERGLRGGQAKSVVVQFGDGVLVKGDQVDFLFEWRDAAPDSLERSTVSDVDIGVIVLASRLDHSIPLLHFPTADNEIADDSMLAAMSMNVGGFPTIPPDGGTRGEMLWGRNCNLLQGSALASDLREFEKFRLFYPVNTLEGLSGAPVYHFDPVKGRALHGIHTSGPTPESPFFPGSALRITKGISLTIQDWLTTFQP